MRHDPVVPVAHTVRSYAPRSPRKRARMHTTTVAFLQEPTLWATDDAA